MLKIFNNLVSVGLNRNGRSISERNLVLTNRIVLFIFIFNLFFFAYLYLTTGWTTFSKMLFVGNASAFVSIFSLNYFGFFNLSRILLSWMISIYPFFTSINTKLENLAEVEEAMYYMPRLFIIITSVVPLLIFSYREWLPLIVSLLGSTVPLLFFDTIHQYLGVGYHQLGFEGSIYHIFNAISLTAYAVFISALLSFKRIIEKTEAKNLELIDSLERKNEELVKKNNRIEEQSKELAHANLEIKVINDNLEKTVNYRTQKIIDQSAQFQIFSYKNSHELRAPLANVLGVLDLLKNTESPEETQKLIDLLNESCKKLDSIVHEINQILNKSAF